jgi:hypothetical protein
MTIAHTTYRCKRPPRKRKAVAVQVPVIVRAGKHGGGAGRSDLTYQQRPKSAIVTIRRKPGRFGDTCSIL